MKTFDEAIEEAERVLAIAEAKAKEGDHGRACDLMAVSSQWIAIADRIDAHGRS